MIKNKIEELIEKETEKMLCGKDEKKSIKNTGSSMKIAILNRGWVAIGMFSRDGDMCKLEGSSVIRDWGTTKGLGQLASEGKQDGTKLDYMGIIEFNILTTVAILDVDESKWK